MWYQNIRIRLDKPIVLKRDGETFTAETIIQTISCRSKKELLEKIETIKTDGTFIETVDEPYHRL